MFYMKSSFFYQLKTPMKTTLLILLSALILMIFTFNKAAAKDSTLLLPLYTPLDNSELIHGTLSSAGSVIVSPILEAWLEEFTKMYPSVDFEMEARGSGSAPNALIDGTALLGAMSRSIHDKEVAAFKRAKHYEPTEIRVSLDALGIIVHPSNPITTISKLQLDAIYSSTRNCKNNTEITAWKTLGWDTPQALEIRFISPVSGGSDFFKEKILCGGEYKTSDYPLIAQDTEMVETISKNKYSLGFASMIAMDNSIKTLTVRKSKQHPSFSPNLLDIANKQYPLTRYLYLYIDKRPGILLPDYISEFIKFIFSRQGQQIALSKGAFPLSPNTIGEQLNKLLF